MGDDGDSSGLVYTPCVRFVSAAGHTSHAAARRASGVSNATISAHSLPGPAPKLWPCEQRRTENLERVMDGATAVWWLDQRPGCDVQERQAMLHYLPNFNPP